MTLLYADWPRGGVAPGESVPVGPVNGANTIFALPGTPMWLLLFRNGLLQRGDGVDYTLSGATITFVTAPTSGDILWAKYLY